jgi:MFS family permease
VISDRLAGTVPDPFVRLVRLTGRPPGGLRAVPSLTPMLVSSWLWHLTRWGGLFCCTYLVTQRTHSPLLSQLVGALIFAPMLVGGFAAGAIADRVDRSRAVLITELALAPVMVAMVVVVTAGAAPVWLVFPYVFALGGGFLVNMTAQRALIVDLSGADLKTRALTMESAGLSSASMAGPLLCGAVIEVFGVAAAFTLLAGALVASILVLLTIPPVPFTRSEVPQVPIRQQVRQSVELGRRSRLLLSMLGVTVVFNVFYFSFTPLVPSLAERFHAHAALTGTMGSMAGAGAVVTGVVLGTKRIRGIGRLFIGGAIVSLTCLGFFTLAPNVGLALAALLIAGGGTAAYGGMQTTLALDGAGPDEQGAALGLMSMAIGSGPIGMVMLGVAAELLGPQLAVGLSVVAGLVVLAAWLRGHPESLRYDAVVDDVPRPARPSRRLLRADE